MLEFPKNYFDLFYCNVLTVQCKRNDSHDAILIFCHNWGPNKALSAHTHFALFSVHFKFSYYRFLLCIPNIFFHNFFLCYHRCTVYNKTHIFQFFLACLTSNFQTLKIYLSILSSHNYILLFHLFMCLSLGICNMSSW